MLRVEKPGLLTTVQDLGRPGYRSAGVPVGGAMDRFALAAANRLVGNPEGAAALECTIEGPVLVAAARCLVAVTGGDLGLQVNGREAPTWTGLFLAEGDRLSFSGRRWGARAYVAVAGGLRCQAWLGSQSTYLPAGRGGPGRPLAAGDELPIGPPSQPVVAGLSLPAARRPLYAAGPELGAIPGPHAGRLPAAARRTLFGAAYRVSNEADRMGYRLEGPALIGRGDELLSYGLAMGCVQLPGSGRPILLMADHQTAGGYPAVAGVGRAWLPLAAQLLPGDHLTFRQVTVTAAQAEWRRLRALLEDLD